MRLFRDGICQWRWGEATCYCRKRKALSVGYELRLFLSQSHKFYTATVEPTQAAVLVSAKQVTVPQAIGTFAPQTGDKYVGFYRTVTNVAAERLTVNQGDGVLRDTTGGVYQPTTASFYPNIGGLQLTTTVPGDIVKGNVIFEVPQNAQLKSITYTGTSNWVVFNL